jgi:ABC-type nitrate/sulfonate/bicarbonate transport system permease component
MTATHVFPGRGASNKRRLARKTGDFACSLLWGAAPFLALIALWQLIVTMHVWPPAFLPSPSHVAHTAATLVRDGELLRASGITIVRVMVAGAIGLVLGMSLAVVMVLAGRLWRVLEDPLNYLQAMGEIGWLPVFVLWVGFNERPIIATTAYTVFFPVFFGTFNGFRSVPKNLIDSVYTLGGSRFRAIANVFLPAALPATITGLRTGMGFAWRTVVLAEFLVAQNGLGVLIFRARSLFRIDIIFVGMVMAGILWLATDKLLLRPLEARTVKRWGIQR